MKIALSVLAWLLILATVIPVIRADAWWIRAFDFPRLQILGLGCGVAIAFWFMRPLAFPLEYCTVGVLIVCLVYQVYTIYPYTPLAASEVVMTSDGSRHDRIAIVVSNVLMENRQAAKFLRIVRDASPDVVLILEADAWWEKQLAPLETDYANTVKKPLPNTYGMLLYSRLPLIAPEVRFLLDNEIPSIRTQLTLASGRNIWLYALHPKPPAPSESEKTTKRDAELLMVGREARSLTQPVIVAGDLNDVAWSRTTALFQKTSKMLDPRIGRGLYNSFSAKMPLLRWPLDHVFHSDDFGLIALKRLPAFGSDHFPVYVSLNLSLQAETQQEEPSLKADERREVEEKIERGHREP